ncbi:VapE domain-containing protein [Spirosoma sp. KNUC1025]|uniref:VapE domain-containing protein n=1 Tax=Spirosoma sp. KNUC1025 TaxID=2894082 RepID=UPI00387099D9|nr:virulence-associated E family protein [Spirosoma sp. KNUC1025]
MNKNTNILPETKINGNKYTDNQAVKDSKSDDQKGSFNKFVAIRKYVTEKYDIRLNNVACDYEYSLKGLNQWKELIIDDLVCELLEYGFKGLKDTLNPFISSSNIPRYDPIAYYFDTLPKWEETEPDYIQQLAKYVETSDNAFFQHQFKMMLVRVVAQAIGHIAFNKHCFTLYGKQNDGKTSFLRFLCPPSLQHYIKDGIDFNGNSKDAKRALAENLFINLDELAQLGKADMNTVKDFMTTSQVKLRIPYDKKDAVMRRRASFVGSTNKQEILTDETGNVRWLVFEIKSINHDKGGPGGYAANVDIDKVWSQAVTLLKSGYRYILSEDEIKYSERNNQQYSYQSDEMALILKYFDRSTPEKGRFLTATDIMFELIEKTGSRVRLNSINIGRACNALKFDKVKGGTSRNAVYGYYLEDHIAMEPASL